MTFMDFHNKLWYVLGEVGSIISARLTAFFGLITGAVGMLDWSPLLNIFGTSTDFNQKQLVGIGAVMFIKGLVDEWVRRHNDPFLKVSNVVEAAPEVAKAKKQVKKVLSKTPDSK